MNKPLTPAQELEIMERLDLAERPACACDACRRLRTARSVSRTVVYFDEARPAWHVAGTPEHAEHTAALAAVAHAHPWASTERLFNSAARAEWDRLTE